MLREAAAVSGAVRAALLYLAHDRLLFVLVQRDVRAVYPRVRTQVTQAHKRRPAIHITGGFTSSGGFLKNLRNSKQNKESRM